MRKKNVVIVLLTVFIFLSFCVLGLSTVFRVREVTVVAPVVSDEAKTEAKQLQSRLEKAYDKESVFFLDERKAQEIVLDFPYFRITRFEKDYPNRLVVEITEDAEVYAVKKASEYYILNAEGTVLGVRNNYINRSDDDNNLLIYGDNLTVQGEKGSPISGDSAYESLFAFLDVLSEKFMALATDGAPRGIRGNIVSVEVQRPVATLNEVVLRLTSVEGVQIFVRMPAENTVQKAEVAFNAYLALSDIEKTTGAVVVWDGVDAVQNAYYEELPF